MFLIFSVNNKFLQFRYKEETIFHFHKPDINLYRKILIDIDLFEIDGNWYISEVNPRFGGGYPHAWACGVRVPEMIVRNLEGQTNVPEIGNYPVGKIMMKYNEIMVR